MLRRASALLCVVLMAIALAMTFQHPHQERAAHEHDDACLLCASAVAPSTTQFVHDPLPVLAAVPPQLPAAPPLRSLLLPSHSGNAPPSDPLAS